MSTKNLKRIEELKEQIDSLIEARKLATEKINQLQSELDSEGKIFFLLERQVKIVKVEETEIMERAA